MNKIFPIAVAVLLVIGLSGCDNSNTLGPTEGKAGKRLMSISVDYDGDGDTDQYTSFHYNDKKQLEKVVIDRDPHIYTYDDTGRNIAIHSDRSESSFEYDEDGNVIDRKGTWQNHSGSHAYQVRYTYDKTNRLAKPLALSHRWLNDAFYAPKSRIYSENGVVTSTMTYTYDKKGNLVRRHYIVPTSSPEYAELTIVESVTTYEYTYDYDHLVKKIEQTSDFDKNGTKEERTAIITHYSYNDAGDVIQERSHLQDSNETSTISYTYDSDGNLEQKIIQYSSTAPKKIWTYRWGDPDDKDNENVLPDFYGYGTIQIYSHLRKGTQLYQQYSQQEIAGTEKAFYHGTATCGDYGYSAANQLSSSVAGNVRSTFYYRNGNSCSEFELLPEHAMYGEESILFGNPSGAGNMNSL
jgi:hypothetical protein